MSAIAIMQGRLVPPVDGAFQCFPRDRWREEFALAATAGLDAIEWIFDLAGIDANPLATDRGITEIQTLGRQHDIAVHSVCADYFMDRPLVRVAAADRTERLDMLKWLLGRCQACGISRMVIPFVDASKIETEADRDDVISALEHVLPTAEQMGVELHLETSLSPDEFRLLLERLPHPMVQVNYDSGNSASLGYAPREEWAAYGERIGSVHIKDRLRLGGTVPLGTGDTNFSALLEAIKAAEYRGPWVLQVARGASGDEVDWARKNRAFLVDLLACK
jgi:hexulose-6-phosphate isomerase